MAVRDMTESARRGDRVAFLRLLVISLLLFAAIALLGVALSRFLSIDEVRLPDVVGLPVAEAEAQFRALDIETRTYTEVVPGALVNAVTSQSPQPGEIVRRGRTVAVGVNVPTNEIELPSLVGNTETLSARVLESLGLELGATSYAFSDLPENQVIAQLPEAGMVVGTGSRIDITVSRGPDVAKLSMPQVRGLSVEAAKQRLQASGFKYIDTRATAVSSDQANTVTDQLPPAGEQVSSTTRVLLGFALPATTVTTVPSLVGTPLAQLQTTLYNAGLYLGTVNYITDPAQPSGITTYAPSGYTLRGAPVEVTINRAGLAEAITDVNVPATPGYMSMPGTSVPGTPAPTGATVSLLDPTTPAATDTPTATSTGQATASTSFQGPPPQVGTIPQTAQTQTTPATSASTANPVTTPTSTNTLPDGGRQIPFIFDPASLGMPAIAEQSFNLRLEVEDERGQRTLIEQVVPAGRDVNTLVTVYGDALLRTFINDVPFQTWNPY